MLGRFGRIGSMANVSSQVNGVITSNRSRLRCQGLCLSQHLSALLNDILSFPAHADNGTRREEFSQTAEKGLFGQVRVVSLRHFLGRPNHLEPYQLVPTLFKTGNNVSDQAPLDTIGFDSQEGTFLVGSRLSPHWKSSFTKSHVVGGGGGQRTHSDNAGQGKSSCHVPRRRSGGSGGSSCGQSSKALSVADSRAGGGGETKGGTRKHDDVRKSL
mmetsp:Transcript_36709/g.104435  ORF Transcript_36709/g.104435 Transcript_36709/m.104435 type:complete len:214 (-) Transcript_36709:38-679(-)